MRDETIYTEKELFLLIADGDEIAFRELFHLYVPLIKSLAIKITKSEAATPDLVQEVFLRIWLSRNKLPEINNPRTWILQIVYHQCFNWLRHQKVRNKTSVELTTGGNEVYDTSPEEIYSLKETSLIIRKAIEQLPPQSKKIYLMNKDEGLKIIEIANKLDLSPQTVKNTLSRSLKNMQEFLAQHGIFLPAFLLCYWLF